ncbi:unnamed protein product [Ceutorhynchus assimilis]|uniref:Uncharacterized protein n=1 Tax=Ceutorhynchus assimilis TaxID=467358 RepID=A0A9N9MEN3_9CUCU|nr:unnamed protein product [Ceutorhynchus assimilis]
MDSKPPNFKAGETNSANIWPKFRQSFEVFLATADLQNADEKRNCYLLLHCMGQEDLDIFNTLESKSNEVDKIDVLIVKFNDYFMPKINVTYERHNFFMRNQKTGENFENDVTKLKSLFNSCDFGKLKKSLIRDRLICGIEHSKLREKLLTEPNLTLKLSDGEGVRVQRLDKSEWTPGKVIRRLEKPRTYLVGLDNGGVLERNRKYLIKDCVNREVPELKSKRKTLENNRPKRDVRQPHKLSDYVT